VRRREIERREHDYEADEKMQLGCRDGKKEKEDDKRGQERNDAI
jgi:hypothetical protein